MAKKAFKQRDLLILAAATVLVIGGFIMLSNQNAPTTQYTVSTPKPINSVNDLNSVSKDLDNLDLNQIDTELNSLSSDASGI